MTAEDGLGVRDSVADLRAAHERMTRARDNARAAGAGDAPEMAPLSARLDAVAVLYREAADVEMESLRAQVAALQALPPPPSPPAVALTPPSAPVSAAPLVSQSAERLSAQLEESQRARAAAESQLEALAQRAAAAEQR